MDFKKKGTIITLRKEGYGFIQIDGEINTVYFHASGVINKGFNDLKIDSRVTFTIVKVLRGFQAVNVVIEP